jgi:hypothetical protein
MGWKLYRIWSTEWFRNRKQSVERLIENVNIAMNNRESKSDDCGLDSSDFDQDCILTNIPAKTEIAGKKYKKSISRIDRKLLMEIRKNRDFANALLRIISDETPMHQDLLLERVRELSRVGRVGSNIKENFEIAIEKLIKDGVVEKHKNDKGFLYMTSKRYLSFRVPDGTDTFRSMRHISSIEIQNAVKYLIKNQFGLAYDNAVQSIKLIFQVPRIDPEESDRVKDIIDEMLQSGIIVKHGPLLNLVSK